MRVGVVSDTHIPSRAPAIPPRVFEVFERIDLILHANEANPKVVELLQRFQEMGNTARKPVELPHEHTSKLMMVCRSHQRLELRPAFFATGDSNVHILCDDL